jgi:phage-related protein
MYSQSKQINFYFVAHYKEVRISVKSSSRSVHFNKILFVVSLDKKFFLLHIIEHFHYF